MTAPNRMAYLQAEDINNYLIQISFHQSCYHKLLTRLLASTSGSTPGATSSDNNDSSPTDIPHLLDIYMAISAVFEEITTVMDTLVDPRKKNRAPLTERQLGFLTENFFKVADIVMTNATKSVSLHSATVF